MSTDGFALSDFQRRVLAVPEEFDLFLGGGRGGGKSFTLALLALRHAEQYGERARVLYVRLTYRGVADFEAITRELFGRAYGPAARFNSAEHVWRLPTGAYVELGQLDGPADYGKYQGRSFTLLLVDEAGHYAAPDLLDRLRSNLRGPRGLPVRVAMAANPGDPGHHWLASRYVFRSGAPWRPFDEPKSGRRWVYAPSTYLDNVLLDRDAYRAQLEASCPGDPELLRAWVEGDWAVARGAFFAGVLAEERVAIDAWDPAAFAALRLPPARSGRRLIPVTMNTPPRRPADADPDPEPTDAGPDRWEVFLAHDFGVSAPSVTFVAARSPGATGPDGRWYPRGSVLLLDELTTSAPGDLSRGLGWTVPRLAEAICDLAAGWMAHAEGVADDACFARTGHGAGSIADEFRMHGVRFEPARKADRRTGWERLRRMLEAAGKPDVPGLYVSRACEYFWATVPYLARDPRRADDVDSRGPDHAADAARYAVLANDRSDFWVQPIEP